MGSVYKTLFRLRAEHKALSRGDMVRVPSSNDAGLYAFWRVAGADKIFAVFNFASERRTDTLMVPMDRLFPGGGRVVLKDAFSGTRLVLTPETEGRLVLAIEARGFRVFVVQR